MLRVLPAAVLVLAFVAAPALAQEVIKTGPEGAPPAAEAPRPAPVERPAAADPNSPEAIGRWARGVLAGEPAQKDEVAQDGQAARPGRCTPVSPDGKAHGEVWAGVGTGGYRNVGGVVTQPLGECGSVTIAVDKTQFDGGRRRHR